MVELYCFGPAGTGIADFRGWSERFPTSIRVHPVRIPGRETLFGTPAFRRMEPLVDWLLEALSPLPRDYAFYGHSMGGWVAYELAHALRQRRDRGLVHLFVGARRAPHLPARHPPLAELPDAAFVEQLQARYGGIPGELLAQPALLRRFLPTVRADLALVEGYVYRDRPPLDVPITAFRGLWDATVDRAEAAAWRRHTAADFALRQLPGGHFFHREIPDLLCDQIRP